MGLPDEVQLSRERVLQALGALESYVHSGAYTRERQKQLSDALRKAIDELLDNIDKLY